MSLFTDITGISSIERTFAKIERTAPTKVDTLINEVSKRGRKIIQKAAPKRTGNLSKAIQNKKIRKADSLTKVLQINGRKAPYGHKINAKRFYKKNGKRTGFYSFGQFMQKAIDPIEELVANQVERLRLV